MFLHGKKGFTLIEIMFGLAIVGFLTIAVTKMYNNGIKAWTFGKDSLKISTEAKITMATLTKFVHNVNGGSIKISRENTNQPSNSYIEGQVVDTIFVTSTQNVCCGSGSDYITVGATVDPVKIFQHDNYLLVMYPVAIPGANITDPDVAHSTYKCMTLTANLDSLMFTYSNTKEANHIMMSVRLKKLIRANEPPVIIFLNKQAVIKHMQSAGYYGN